MNELTFEVEGNTYTIKVPTVGQMNDVERLKMILSGGYYNEMIKTLTFTSQEALMVIDIQSSLSVLCPKLIEDLKCTDIKKLSATDYVKLKKVYIELFIPWWNKWLEIFKGEAQKDV